MNMRPGITIQTSISKTKHSGFKKGLGIVCDGLADATHNFQNLEQLKNKLGENSAAYQLSTIAVGDLSCPIVVEVVKQKTLQGYTDGIKRLILNPDVYVMLSNFTSNQFNLDIANIIKNRMDIIFCSSLEPSFDPIQHAKQLNQRNIVLTTPKVTIPFTSYDCGCAIVANNILAYINSKGGLSTTKGYQNILNITQTEEQKNQLLYNGVTVLEKTNGLVKVIRYMTTNTVDQNGNYTTQNRNLSTSLKLLKVYSAVKNAVSSQFYDTGYSTISALNSTLVTTLQSLKLNQDLSSYNIPQITIDPADQSKCNVGLTIVLPRGVEQISMSLEFNL